MGVNSFSNYTKKQTVLLSPTGKCAPPAAGGRPCRRASAPWTGRGGGAAAPQRPLHAGAALCCLVGSMLVLCATFSRLQWRCTASHGEWHAACAAPRLARTAPESALDGPACAARAPHKLTHRLPFSGRRRSISRLSIKTGGLCDAVYAIVLGFAFSFACFYFVFSFAKRRRGGRAGANYGQLHVEGSRSTTRRLGRLGRAAPSRTGRAPYPARRRSHSVEKGGGTVDSPIHQLLSSSGAWPRATAVRQAAPKAPRAAAGLGVMLRHSYANSGCVAASWLCVL